MVITPPAVSIPKESGVISSSKLLDPFTKLCACNAAPFATTKSGFISEKVFRLNSSVIVFLTKSNLVEPPTNIIPLKSFKVILASVRTLLEICIVLSIKLLIEVFNNFLLNLTLYSFPFKKIKSSKLSLISSFSLNILHLFITEILSFLARELILVFKFSLKILEAKFS